MSDLAKFEDIWQMEHSYHKGERCGGHTGIRFIETETGLASESYCVKCGVIVPKEIEFK